jgi:hypothetical protein
MLACQAIAVTWYATVGHSPADTAARRANAPWYTAKTEPSTADMTAKLRRVIIAAKFKLLHPDPKKSMPFGWPGKTPKTSPPKQRKSSSQRDGTNAKRSNPSP